MSEQRDAARVAAVIVNYQSYDELRTCLASLSLSREPIATVVVDHASDPVAAAAVARDFPDAQLICNPGNDGFAAGVNRGTRRTTARYVLLVNPDCVVEPETARLLARWLDAHPRAGAAGPRIRNADGTVQASARRFPDLTTAFAGRSSWLTRVLPDNPLSRRNLVARGPDSTEPVGVDWVSGACVLVRREAFDEVGGMDEGFFLYWEDADFCRRLERAGWRTYYCPAAGATHTGARSSRHAADASLEAFHRSAFRLFWKHAGGAGKLLAPLVFAGLQARLLLMKRVVRRKR